MRLCAARGRIIERLLPPPLRTNPGCRLLNRNAILPLAGLGYSAEGLDVSAAQITRAERECAVRGLHCKFRVDDMRTLATVRLSSYAAVMAMDNALPHSESDNDIAAALTAMRSRLLPRGKVILSIRDYDSLLRDRPSCVTTRFYSDEGRQRIVFQIWDCTDERRYGVHLYVTRDTFQGWITHHFQGSYRAVTTDEIARLAKRVGLGGQCSQTTGHPLLPADHFGSSRVTTRYLGSAETATGHWPTPTTRSSPAGTRSSTAVTRSVATVLSGLASAGDAMPGDDARVRFVNILPTSSVTVR